MRPMLRRPNALGGEKEKQKRPIEGGTDQMTLLRALVDQVEATNAGVPLEQWTALSKKDRIRLTEDSSDLAYAKDQRQTLEEYRTQKRVHIEAGHCREDYGFPQWLRDQYAKENPAKIAVEYLNLLMSGERAVGEDLKEIIRQIEARSLGGWGGAEMTFAEAKERLLEEIDRVGLGEFFREAETQRRRSIQ